MDEEQTKPALGFFERCGLNPLEYHCCRAFAQQLRPGQQVRLVPGQGYCSLTFLVGDDKVVQFRPVKHRLDLRITFAAGLLYGSLAPRTEYIGNVPTSGLLAYSMDRISGMSLEVLRTRATPTAQSTAFRARLCRDFAAFLSKAWYNRREREFPHGKVGESIVPRLQALCTKLPLRFQSKARKVLAQLPLITALPWVLSHGDIVAANIIVDRETGSLAGMVDWAEAESLPFGVCLYGLEEILGEQTPTGFQYHPDASFLRIIFWDELRRLILDLKEESVLKAVRLARDLGVLLWHGIAYDDGAIDRVVQEGRDDGEIHRLDAFLADELCGDMTPKI